MVTIRDVARLAGVSPTTISHVLNNTRWVSPETRQAVLKAVEQLQYRPNAIARSLTTNITQTAAILVADITNAFFASLVRNIEDLLSAHDYNLIVCNTQHKADKETRYLNLLLEKQIDGIIVASSTAEPQPLFEQFISQNTALVFVDRQPPEPYGPVVSINNFRAGYAGTEHLLKLGHRRIGIVSGDPTVSSIIGRVNGYRQALRDYGLTVDESLIVHVVPPMVNETFLVAQHLLKRQVRPTALVATNQTMALGTLQALQKLNLVCPADISLICFGDHLWTQLFTPPLTVISQPIAEICRAAVDLLLDSIALKRQRRRETVQPTNVDLPNVVLETKLTLRGSCRRLTTAAET